MSRSNRRGPGGIRRPFHPAPPELSPNLPEVQDVEQQQLLIDETQRKIRARGLAISQSLLERSPNEVFDRQGIARNPVATVPITGVPVVSFQVPTGQILKLNHIGISYSDPFIGQTVSLGWWLTIQDSQVPFITQSTPGLDYFFFSHHQLGQPTLIEDLWIQTQETVAIQVYPTFGFAEQVTIMATMAGRLYKPGTPEIGGI